MINLNIKYILLTRTKKWQGVSNNNNNNKKKNSKSKQLNSKFN